MELVLILTNTNNSLKNAAAGKKIGNCKNL